MLYINVYYSPKGTATASYSAHNHFIDSTKKDMIQIGVFNKENEDIIFRGKADEYHWKKEYFNAMKRPDLIGKSDEEVKEILFPQPKTKQSKLDSNKRYLSKFKEIKLRITEDLKNEIQCKAEIQNMSIQSYILSLIQDDLNIDKKN